MNLNCRQDKARCNIGRKSRRSAAELRNALQQKRDVEVDGIASEEEANNSELRKVPMSEIPDNELTDDDVVIADENGDELTKELKIMWDAFFVAKKSLSRASVSFSEPWKIWECNLLQHYHYYWKDTEN